MKRNRLFFFFVIFITSLSLLSSVILNTTTLKADEENTTTLSEPIPLGLLEDNCKKICQFDESYSDFQDIYILEEDDRSLAFIAAYDDGLLIFDIHDISSPVLLSQYSNTTGAYLVCAEGTKVFLGIEFNEILIIDISDILKPLRVSSIDDDLYYIRDIKIHNNYLYVQNYYYYPIQIFDIRNPFNVNVVNTINQMYHTKSLHFFNDLLLIDDGILRIFNISIITDIVNVQNYSISGDFTSIHNEFIFQLENNLLSILNWSTNQNLTKIFTYSDNRFEFRGLHITDDFLYLIGYRSGLVILDISNKSNITLREIVNLPGYYVNSLSTEKNLFLIDTYVGLKIISLGDSESKCEFVGFIQSNSYSLDVFVKDSIAYVVNGYAGLSIYDIRNPFSPKKIAHLFSEYVRYIDVVVEGNYAYIFDSFNSEIVVVDVTNPKNPVIVNTLENISLHFGELRIFNSNLCLLSNYNYVYTLELFSLENPINISSSAYYSFEIYDSIYNFYITNSTLFTTAYNGVFIYTMTEANELIPISSYTDGFVRTYDLQVVGSFAYLAVYNYGLKILDISDIENPILVASEKTSDSNNQYGARHIFVENNHIYLSNMKQGLTIYHAYNPNEPTLIARFYYTTDFIDIYRKNYGNSVSSLFVYDNIIYLASGLDGLVVAHCNDLPMNKDYLNKLVTFYLSTSGTIVGIIVIIFTIRRYNKRKYSL